MGCMNNGCTCGRRRCVCGGARRPQKCANLVPNYCAATVCADTISINVPFFPTSVSKTSPAMNGSEIVAPFNGYYTITLNSTNLAPVQWNIQVNGRNAAIMSQQTANTWVTATVPVAACDRIRLSTISNETTNGTINYYGGGGTNATFIPTK